MEVTMRFATVTLINLCFSACATTDSASPQMTSETVPPGSEVSRSGTSVKLLGSKALHVGQSFPEAMLVDSAFTNVGVHGEGQVRLISIVPSIDTKVCEQQTHWLGEAESIHPGVLRVTVSRDLPMAQKRFAQEANLESMTYLSDFKHGEFGEATGLMMEGSGLLARALIVVDQGGIVRHLQVVPDVTMLPDMEKAIAVANELIERRETIN